MTEPKLHTTREERDGYRREDGKRDEPSDYFKLALVDDVNTLEDELARVREELACERILREGAEWRALMILDSKNAINDKLREENKRLSDAVDSLCRARQSEKQEQDKLRERLEKAERLLHRIARYNRHACTTDDASDSIVEGAKAYLERFGGRDE